MKPKYSAWSLALLLPVASMVLGQDPSTGSGQAFPNKPIRIVTGLPGGGNDFAARVIAQGLTGPVAQPVIVDNRAGTVIPVTVVAKAPADGYTLLVAGTTFMLTPLLQSVPFDPVRDFSPITLVEKTPNVLAVHPSVPVKSVKELIALAKAKPGQLNYGSATPGGTLHLSTELFKSMVGVDVVQIVYKGNGPAITALVGGEVQLMFVGAAQISPHVKSGKVRALASTGLRPSVLIPGLPTVSETVPGYESVSLTAVLAPAKTPAAVINRLNQEIVRVLNQADVKEKLFNAGVEAVGSSPQELAAAMKTEIATSGKIIKDRGIRAE